MTQIAVDPPKAGADDVIRLLFVSTNVKRQVDDDAGLRLIIAAALDVALTRGAKRHIWVRVISAVMSLFLMAVIVAVVYITFRYS